MSENWVMLGGAYLCVESMFSMFDGQRELHNRDENKAYPPMHVLFKGNPVQTTYWRSHGYWVPGVPEG